MNSKTNSALAKIIALFLICSVVEYIEFLFIRTDQTIVADNIGTKIFCILAVIIMLKCSELKLADIGFRTKRILRSIFAGIALGVITFGISYFVEILILRAQGHTVSLDLYVTNFAITGATTQVTAAFIPILICVAVNIVNVLAEEGLFRGVILKLGTDRFGFSAETLEPLCPPVWAYFRQLSGKEVFTAASIQATEEVLFQVNYRPDITTAHIIRYNGTLYDITRVDVFEGYKEDLTLYCKKKLKIFHHD